MASIADFEALVPLDHGLCTVAIGRGDRTPQVTVVNAGVVEHPVTAAPAVAFVTAGGARKLTLLYASSRRSRSRSGRAGNGSPSMGRPS